MSNKLNINFCITEEDLYMHCPYTPVELEAKMKLFLTAYIEYGVIAKSCEVAGISRNTYMQWRKNISKFDEIFTEVEETFTDRLEMEANRRALEKSDSLLQFLLRARRPQKFNPPSNVNATLDGAGGIKLVFSEGELSPEERAILEGRENRGDSGE